MKVNFIKTEKNVPVPSKSTSGSAGFDLTAHITEAINLLPGIPVKIPTGIAIEPDTLGCVILLFSRSGLSKYGVGLANAVGVIDSDYRGEIGAVFINNSNTEYVISPGDRIAQIVFLNIEPVELELVESLTDTERGDGGFGHSGK